MQSARLCGSVGFASGSHPPASSTPPIIPVPVVCHVLDPWSAASGPYQASREPAVAAYSPKPSPKRGGHLRLCHRTPPFQPPPHYHISE
ncbi:hypothetical protein L226DRAFT_125752 [Lentinus tigrinus ALCF2SS1-7]|uniref:uncharacterized protein n=1 Tax=Lentinus tigrinus ALCF2SS1-7 TaxID=1328758 RepID=UPI00116631DF|nr:hypothetical protein L226DRAFT_125752 [Lentinus tigrinus ALCF2SS1-7]